jgi:sugar diacid utilization regulator
MKKLIYIKKNNNYMKITLTQPKEIVIVEKKTETIQELTIERTVDLPGQKIVRCFIIELNEPVVLWEGNAYDQIGQWTDADVEMRLKEIFA